MQRLPSIASMMLWTSLVLVLSVVKTFATSEPQVPVWMQPNQPMTTARNTDQSRLLANEDSSNGVVVDEFSFVTSHDPFFKSCKILKQGMKYSWDHAITCECDETKWEAVCSIRYSQLNNCLNDNTGIGAEYAAGRPCTSNMTASFVRPPGDDYTMASLDQFRLCSVFASFPRKEACATFQYSNGTNSIPFDCDVMMVVDDGGVQSCRSCLVCGRYAFTVDCANILPLQLDTCQVFDRPELDFFTQFSLSSGDDFRVTTEQRLVTKDTPQQSNHDSALNPKASNAIGVHAFTAWLMGLATASLLSLW